MYFTRLNRQVMAVLSIAFYLLGVGAVQAEHSLKGSATYTIPSNPMIEVRPLEGSAYHPNDQNTLIGDNHVRNYKLGRAEEYYRKALSLNSQHAGGYNGLGKILYYRSSSSEQSVREDRAGLLTRAEQYYLMALRLKPNYAEARLNLGVIYLEQGRMDEAIEEFLRVLTLEGLSRAMLSETYERVGMALVRQGEHNTAMPYLEEAIAMSPRNWSARYYLGKALTERGEYTRAYEQLRMALERDPDNANVHHQLGVVFERQGNGAAAVAEFRKALLAKPELRGPAEDLANHYLERGDQLFALEQLKNTLEAYPEDVQLGVRVAGLSLAAGQPEEAIRYYEHVSMRASKDSSEYYQSRKGIARAHQTIAERALMKQGNYTERLANEWQAKTELQETLRHEPGNLDAQLMRLRLNDTMQPDAFHTVSLSRGDYAVMVNQMGTAAHDYLLRGEALLDRYQFKQADESLQHSIRLVDNANDAIALGEIMMKMGMPDLAEHAFFRAAQLGATPEFSRFCQFKAIHLKQESQSKVQAGIRQFKQNTKSPLTEQYFLEAIKLDQKNADAHYYLARHYERLSEDGKAADHYFAYLQLNPYAENANSIQKKLERYKQKSRLG